MPTPKPEKDPTKEGFVFKAWSPAVADKVTKDATYFATWSEDANGNGTADEDEAHFTVTYLMEKGGA